MNLFPGGFNNLSDEMLPAARAGRRPRDRADVPGRAQPAAGSRAPHAEPLLPAPTSPASSGSCGRPASKCGSARCPTRSRSARRSSCRTARRWCSSRWCARGDRLGVEGFDPCVVLLNNDLSAGIPAVLRGLDPGQILVPPLQAGWAVRRKSNHFAAYDEVARGVLEADRHRSLADQPVLRALRPGQLPRARGRGVRRQQRRLRHRADAGEVSRVRHHRHAVRGREGRRRHLRHGRDDGARLRRGARPEPQAAQQDGGREGRPGGHRGDHPGGRADARGRRRRVRPSRSST